MADALLPLRPLTTGDWSMNCEFPRFMSTERPLVWLALLRMLPLRLIVSRRPRTRSICVLNVSFTVLGRNAGPPLLPRAVPYAPRFSPMAALKEGSVERGVSSVLLRLRLIVLLQYQMKKATRPMTAMPPMTPPAMATAGFFWLVPPDTATNVVVEPGASDEIVAEEAADAGLLKPIVVNTAAGVDVVSVPKTSLWGGLGVTAGTVDEAALLVSATLACVCGKIVAAGDEVASEGKASMENWAMDADEVMIAGGGVVAAAVVASTCGGADTDTAVDTEEEEEEEEDSGDGDGDGGDKTTGGEDKIEVLAVLELACVLTSVLGRAVHLLPPSEVMKAPGGRFGLVDMTETRVAMSTACSLAIPVAIPRSTSDDDSAHCATGASKCDQNVH